MDTSVPPPVHRPRYRPHVVLGILGVGLLLMMAFRFSTAGPGSSLYHLRESMLGLIPRDKPAPIAGIQFHGIIQDDEGNPVPLAMFEFQNLGGGLSGTRVAGSDGRFTFSGPSEILTIEAMGPHGIHAKRYWRVPFPSEDGVTSYQKFRFVDDPSMRTRYDSPAKAFVFTVWSPPEELGTPLVVTDFHFSSVNPAGTPLTIQVNDASGATRDTILIRYHSKAGPLDRTRKDRHPWDTSPTPPLPAPYAWGTTVTPTGATIMEKDPAQARPEAHADGYLPAVSIDFPATMAKADWKPSAMRRCYLRFGDGTYGVMTLRINSETHEVRGKIRRNSKPGERDLTGIYNSLSGPMPSKDRD